MFAVVCINRTLKKHRLVFTDIGRLRLLELGEAVGRRKALRRLSNFGGEVILGHGAQHLCIKPFDTDRLAEELLFESFCEYVISNRNRALNIGIHDPCGRFLKTDGAVDAVSIARRTVIVTASPDFADLSDRFRLFTGACPTVTDDNRMLYSCDVCFSFSGLPSFSGRLFGKASERIADRFALPEKYRRLLSTDVDISELLCMLYRENELKTRHLSQKTLTLPL